MTITLTREEAQQVLDALNSCDETWVYDGEDEQIVDQYDHKLVAKAKELFNAKIAQPDLMINGLTEQETAETMSAKGLAQPERKWQELSDYDVDNIVKVSSGRESAVYLAEAKLKERNS